MTYRVPHARMPVPTGRHRIGAWSTLKMLFLHALPRALCGDPHQLFHRMVGIYWTVESCLWCDHVRAIRKPLIYESHVHYEENLYAYNTTCALCVLPREEEEAAEDELKELRERHHINEVLL